MKLESLDDQLMATAAMRYCLGRQTYIVSSCHDWIRATWDQFDRNTQNVMLRDMIDAICRDMAGADMDRRGWQKLTVELLGRIDDPQLYWLLGALWCGSDRPAWLDEAIEKQRSNVK